MYCKKCGTRLGENDQFCFKCGEKQVITSKANTVYCVVCGNEFLNGAKFCHKCGKEKPVFTNSENGTRVMKCKVCNAIMDLNADGLGYHCPYCGTNEVIEGAAADRARSQAYREIEMNRIKTEAETERYKADREKEIAMEQMKRDEKLRNHVFSRGIRFGRIKWAIGICAFVAISSVGLKKTPLALVEFAQVICFTLSLLIAKGSIGTDPRKHTIPWIIGLLLVIPNILLIML